jgi:hypothetical protein
MEILTHTRVSWSCDGCKKAAGVDVKMGASAREMSEYVSRAHREMSSSCPRDKAVLSGQRSYLDSFANTATPHFKLTWRDADELGLTKEEKKGGPMIVIG